MDRTPATPATSPSSFLYIIIWVCNWYLFVLFCLDLLGHGFQLAFHRRLEWDQRLVFKICVVGNTRYAMPSTLCALRHFVKANFFMKATESQFLGLTR
jgi:hypothetical protein